MSRVFAFALAACAALVVSAAAPHPGFDERLRIASSQDEGRVTGRVDAVVDFPFARVRDALSDAHNWCEILILHPNVEHCDATRPAAGDGAIALDIGRVHLPMKLSHHVSASTQDALRVLLVAPDGPLGTTDYRIALDAAPLDATRTTLHFTFAHGYGARAQVALAAYLATWGRDKVGFTVAGADAGGEPRYVGGLRGALERNAMRCYLAIEAYLGSLDAPRAEQRDARLRAWYAASQRFARQLHEDGGFVARKQAELARQPLPS